MTFLAVDLEVIIPNSIALVCLIILAVLFIYHAQKQNRPVQNLLISLIWGIIYAVLTIIYGLNVIKSDTGQEILKTTYLTCLSIQVVFFYLFFENSRRVKPNLVSTSVIFSLFSLQMIGFWGLALFPASMENMTNLGLFLQTVARLALNILPIVVYGIIGIPIYYNMYKYTNEKKPLVFLVSVSMVSFGYFLIVIIKIVQIFNPAASLPVLKLLGDGIPVIGLLVFMLVYALNIQYIYRLPYDHFLLMVSHKSGLIMLSIPFETKNKEIKIEEHLFSGMLTALKSVYNEVLKVNKPIKMIINEEVSIYMESGEHISAIVATTQISGVLARGLKIFVERFEKTFGDKLEETPKDLNDFKSGIYLFMRIFPFLTRKHALKE